MAEPPHQPTEAAGEAPAPAATEVAAGARQRDPGGALLLTLARFSIPIALLIAAIGFSIARPDTFFTEGNFDSIVGNQAVLLIVALAVTVPLAAGDFDLSIGSVAGLSMALTAVLIVKHSWAWPLAALAAVGVGCLVGAINGLLVAGIGLNAFVVTLGTSTVLLGVTSGVSGDETVGPISSGLVDLTTKTWVFGLPLVSLYALILVIVVWYLFSHTPVGRYLLFVGGGSDAARLAGLPVRGLKLGAFVAASLLCALAGILYAGQLGASDPSVGPSLLLPAFAAAFLGATTITPGRFNPWGTFFALYLIETCIAGLEQLGLPLWTENVFNGTVLVAAILFSHLVRRRADV